MPGYNVPGYNVVVRTTLVGLLAVLTLILVACSDSDHADPEPHVIQ